MARAGAVGHEQFEIRSTLRTPLRALRENPSLALPVRPPRQDESTWAREIWEAVRWLNGGKGGTGVAKRRRERGREDGDGVERRDGGSAPTVLER